MSAGTTGITLEDVVNMYSPLVGKIANHYYSRTPPSVLIEDLIQEGFVGLIKAFDSFNDSGAEFGAYAAIRIRGAIIDSLRRENWKPRNINNRKNLLEKYEWLAETCLGRRASSAEVAQINGITEEKYHKLRSEYLHGEISYASEIRSEDLSSHAFLSDLGCYEFDLPAHLYNIEVVNDILQAVSELDSKQQAIFRLFFQEGWKQKEIAVAMNLHYVTISLIIKKLKKIISKRVPEYAKAAA